MIGFVETSVSRLIHSTIDFARTRNTNAAIIGAPGVGKTMALKAYAERNHLVARITITPVLSGSLRSLMYIICNFLSVSVGGRSIHEIESALLRRGHFGDWIFIIDEAQNLPLKSFRQLLHLSSEDDGTMKFVFCGNNEVLKRVNTDRGAFAQISRRIRFRETINSIDNDDSDAISNSFGIEGMDAYLTMRAVGERFQADGVVQVLQMAQDLAGKETIKAKHIDDAINIFPQYRTALETRPTRRKGG